MLTLCFSEDQLAAARPWYDFWVRGYLKQRYGRAWRWYWQNWEINHELLL